MPEAKMKSSAKMNKASSGHNLHRWVPAARGPSGEKQGYPAAPPGNEISPLAPTPGLTGKYLWPSLAMPPSHPEPNRPESHPSVQEEHTLPIQDLLDSAQRTLDQARQRASEMLHNAKKEAEAITLQAHLENQTAAKAEASALLQVATSIVNEVKVWQEIMLAQSEAMVLNLVEEIVRTMFGAEIHPGSEVLQQIYRQALSEAKTLGRLRIHANSEDIAILKPLWADQNGTSEGRTIELVPDEGINRGGAPVSGTDRSGLDIRTATKVCGEGR